MNNLPSIPSPDSGFRLMEPMTNGQVAPGAKFRPQKILYFLRKFWWIPVIGLIVGTAAATVNFCLKPPVFVSSGSLWETEKLRLPDGADFADNPDNYLGTQDALLRSKKLRELTLAQMNAFNTNPIIANILQQLAKDDGYLPVDITMLASPKTSVYVIQARSANPLFTPAYLDALMQSYLDFRKNSRQMVSADTLNSISQQILRIENDIKSGQDALGAYEQSNDIPVLQQESTVEAAYLAKLKTELSGYELEIGLLSATEDQTNSLLYSANTDTDASNVTASADATNAADTMLDLLHNSDSQSPMVTGLLDAQKQIQQLMQKRDRLPKNLSTNAPEIVELNDEIAQAQNLINFYRQQDHQQHVATREALHIKIGNIQQFIKEWEGKLAVDNARIATADSLKQNIARNQNMFDRLSSLVQNVDIGKNIDQDTLAILEPASPSSRSYREAETAVVQGGFMGLGIGLGVILLLSLRDDRFHSMVEVSERFGDTVVGQVPEAMLDAKSNLPLLVGNDARHAYAESYRNLRSALMYFGAEGRRPQVLLITSAVPNEGKSTIATNLARAMALGGSRVLLVDGDMRKGHIHDLLQLKSKPGLSELLRQSGDWMSYIQATDLSNFSFLARGGIVRDPGDLFLNPAVDQLIGRLREHYDYILIDSGPVFASDDTPTLAPKTDGTLFVVRSHFTHARMVREALAILFQRQAQVLGLILNRTNSTERSYYLYKYGEYETKDDAVEVETNT